MIEIATVIWSLLAYFLFNTSGLANIGKRRGRYTTYQTCKKLGRIIGSLEFYAKKEKGERGWKQNKDGKNKKSERNQSKKKMLEKKRNSKISKLP